MQNKSELQVFREYLQTNGLRYTHERETIIKEILATPHHFNVDTLYLNIRQKGIRISKASIYRLLPLLLDAGLIQEVAFEDGHMQYEHIYGRGHHNHLRCIECRRIEEFTDPRMKEIEKDLHKRFGFEILDHKLEVRGLCPECQQKIKKM
jgi:Fur family ferric uptake transcriptional regulator